MTIKKVLESYGLDYCVFVENYSFSKFEEQEMMECAVQEIEKCDILLAEVSVKAVGVGVEVGYAKARGKKVVYLRESSAKHSTTVSGLSDYHIVYSDEQDLSQQVANTIRDIQQEGNLSHF